MTNGKLNSVIDLDTARSSTDMEKRKREELNRFHAKAREMGFYALNPAEKQLIELLRWTNYHGRNVVVDVAQAMQKSHPWVDGAGAGNTSTTYPDSGRFFHLSEG